jgi:HEAT repeat protein
MKHKYVIVASLAIGLVILLIAFAIFLAPAGEPRHNGKSLSEWLELANSTSDAERVSALLAIREIGDKALPFLEELLQKDVEPGVIQNTLQDFSKEVDPISMAAQAASLQHWRDMAFAGYRALGRLAQPSVPQLIVMLESDKPHIRSNAAGALGWIGAAARDAAPQLIVVLHSDNVPYVRRDAAASLGRLATHSEDEEIISALRQALNDPDASVRQFAQYSLERISKY